MELQHSNFATYLRNRAIIPEIALVREAVVNKPGLAILYVLLDWIEKAVAGDLCAMSDRDWEVIFSDLISNLAFVHRGISMTTFRTRLDSSE